MYILFLPTFLTFIGIFTLSLHTQFVREKVKISSK
jgi:hypothetical protein